MKRRELLLGGLGGLALGAVERGALAFPGAGDLHPERILVVVELAGGNDGLDTLIPLGDDGWHRARPTLRISARGAHRLDVERAFHPALDGLHRRWREGRLAIVEGCGHPAATRSHFDAMRTWHRAAATGGDAVGWIGRLADDAWSEVAPAALITVGATPSPALRSRRHAAVVFSDPERSVRWSRPSASATDMRRETPEAPGAIAAIEAIASRVRAAIRSHRAAVDYGAGSIARDLRSVAALIGAGFPSRVYYVGLGGFDTHADQSSTRPPLLRGLGDALDAFDRDLRRLGRGEQVATLVFSEFGRRLEENASGGTDHGSAGPVFVLGGGVVPGIYGARSSREELDARGDLEPTTDFRRVYASVARDWLGCDRGVTAAALGGHFEPLPIFS